MLADSLSRFGTWLADGFNRPWRRRRSTSSVTANDGSLLGSVTRRCFGLWLRWLLANVVGGVLSWIFGQMLAPYLSSAVGGPVGFLLLPLMQSIVLRRYLSQLSWIFVSFLGQFIGYYVWISIDLATGLVATISMLAPDEGGMLLGVRIDAWLFWDWTLALFVTWSVVGVAQWRVLRRYVEHSGWWVVGCALAGAVSGVAMVVVLAASDEWLLGWVVRWTVHGAITGLVLVMLLQSSIRRRLAREVERQRASSALISMKLE